MKIGRYKKVEKITKRTFKELDDSAEENSSRPLDSDSRSRISFKNVAQKVNYFRQRNSLSVDNSISEIPEKSSESNIAQLYLPPRKMVAIKGNNRETFGSYNSETEKAPLVGEERRVLS